MFLEVPVLRVECLPNTVQVRFAVRRTWCLAGLGSTRGRYHAQLKGSYHQGRCSTPKYSASQSISHLRLLSKPTTLLVPQVQPPNPWGTLALSAYFRESIAFSVSDETNAFACHILCDAFSPLRLDPGARYTWRTI